MVNSTLELVHRHGSVRKYRPDPVPVENIEAIISAAQHTSTSSNMQAYSVIAVMDAAKRGRLAEVGLASQYRVGKYGVDLAFLEQTAIPGLYVTAHSGRLVVLDEIGPMECFSAAFRGAALDLLASDCDLLGTIVQRSHPFADQIKKLHQVEIIEVRPDNRESLIGFLCERLMKI